MYRFPACKKDPSAALGMTKRGTGCLTLHLIPLREPTSAPAGHLLPEEGGRSLFPCYRVPRIVISSEARNLLCTPVNGECEMSVREVF